MSKSRLLIVDDDPGILFPVGDFLRGAGHEVAEARSFEEALGKLRTIHPDAAIIDCYLPDGNAVELLPSIKEIDPNLTVLILTGNASIDLAVQAIQRGADQFLTKPVELPALVAVLDRMLEARRGRIREQATRVTRRRETVDPFVGFSPQIRQLADQAERIARSDSPILILGETGSGKSVLARWIHDHSLRREEAFVDINCAGLNRDFLETELFGHEKGAFTGASSAKVGLFEVADRGTAFLDEIGDMDIFVQVKLLKVLEEKKFRRMGETKDRHVNIRLVAATHQDLNTLVLEKRFRNDLYFRINTVPLTVPPLRERLEDIPTIAHELLKDAFGREDITFCPSALRALQDYRWPGNIRELKNILERAILLANHTELKAEDLFLPSVTSTPVETGLTLKELEARHVRSVLAEEKGSVERTAKRLGISRSSLYMKIKEYGIVASKE